MLVLSREVQESIMIGDEIEIKIIRISRKKTRIAISAPKELAIHRKEVYERIQKEKEKDNDAGSTDQ